MRFSPSCSATLLLFKSQQMPIFPSNDRRRRADERKKDTMIAALARFIQEWKRYNQSLSELSRLGDRELADIGISRSDIPRVAWNAAHEH
jgi:uncharacterized protein YjiS (DUF1127 family)